MARLRYSAQAKRDLVSLTLYIAERSGSRVIAARFAARIRARCRRIAASPIAQGRPRPDLIPDVRSAPFGNYMIFFRHLGDVVEIVNVIEGHRDIDAIFRKND
jgi:plasmid stabilization system protein ParE